MPAVASVRIFKFWPLPFLLAATIVSAFARTEPSSSKTDSEQRTARAFEMARRNRLDLRAFLFAMPKGADLHNHLSGAVYAESWIRAAAEDGRCVDKAKKSLFQPPNATNHGGSQPRCGEASVPASEAYQDQGLYDTLVDAFSMRGFVPSSGVSAHDHFFDSFGRFDGDGTDPRHTGEWLDEVATRAAAQNEQYLELMHTPNFDHTSAIATEIGWRDDFGEMRERLLARGLRDDVEVAKAGFDRAEALRAQREHCGQQDEAPACRVQIRYLYQVLRGLPKEIVFAQTLLGFETASADRRVVGINYVMPEDGYTSMHDYALHMRIVGFLHNLYPKIPSSLHAGELAPGLVPPEGLCCHIRLAIEEAHAVRIGHGVDVMYEDRPYELLKELARKHILVEINLTSNELILGVAGRDHPLPLYRKFGVPVALSTDDEGVSRIDLTHEYVKAVETFGLHYLDLKQMVRTGIEYSFLLGDSLWRDPGTFKSAVSACPSQRPGEDKPSPMCSAFLHTSEKARQQWELERRFRVFESSH